MRVKHVRVCWTKDRTYQFYEASTAEIVGDHLVIHVHGGGPQNVVQHFVISLHAVHYWETFETEAREHLEQTIILAAVMHCPFCGARHVDEGEWETRPHHKHLCLSCNRLWRVEPYCRGIPEATPAAPQVETRCPNGWCGTTVAGGELEGMPVFCPEHLPPLAPQVEVVGTMGTEQVPLSHYACGWHIAGKKPGEACGFDWCVFGKPAAPPAEPRAKRR